MPEHCGVIAEVKAREPSVSSVIRRSYVKLGISDRDGRSRFETDITDQHCEPFIRMKALVHGIQFEPADHDESLVSSLVEPLERGILLTECSVKRCQSPTGQALTVGFSRLLQIL